MVHLIDLALLTLDFVLEQLCLVELSETVIQCCVVRGVYDLCKFLLLCGGMIDDLISDGIIAIGDNLSVPLDCYETFPDEFFFKDRGVSRVYHAATAFLLPVA